MQSINNLEDTPLETIVACLLKAFDGYFVKMPDNVAYWRNRFKGARVDWKYSFGYFEEDELVGFIINGVDQLNGHLTAFNTGTGVLPKHRGQQIVDKLYDFGLTYFKEKGIEQCTLEVIQANTRAIKVYERIGFRIQRNLKCFKGTLRQFASHKVLHKAIDFQTIASRGLPEHSFYSWDHTNEAIHQLKDKYETYEVFSEKEELKGYFTINPTNGYVAQIESNTKDFDYLIAGIQQITPSIRINNVDDRRTKLVQALLGCGLENTIDQYEMRMQL